MHRSGPTSQSIGEKTQDDRIDVDLLTTSLVPPPPFKPSNEEPIDVDQVLHLESTNTEEVSSLVSNVQTIKDVATLKFPEQTTPTIEADQSEVENPWLTG